MVMKLLILIFGLLYAIRMIKYNKQNDFFDQNILLNLLATIIFLTLLSIFYFLDTNFSLWMVVFAWILLIRIMIFVVINIREAQFRQDFVEFLDRAIIRLRSGESFRVSLESSNVDSPLFARNKISKIVEAAVFSQNLKSSSPFVREIFAELRFLIQNPQKTLEKILVFRRKLKIEDYFRRKSGTVKRQIQIQALFLSALYVAVQIFVIQRFGFAENFNVEIISITLFLIGLIAFIYKGEQKIWKI